MGAHNFEQTIYTQKSMRDAYDELVQEALHEDGHNGYNGTISTTGGVIASPLSSTPVREDQIDWSAVSERLDHLEKRGYC